MRRIRDAVTHAVLGALGFIFGAVSGIAMVIAAIIPALLGLLAFVFSPLRALIERLRP